MKINYVTIANDFFASFRYHIKTPAMELKRLGHNVVISGDPEKDADAYIFHKHLRSEEQYLIKAVKFNNRKAKTYFICCDYHLDNKHSEHYFRMINACDVLVVCTEAMRKLLKDETGKDGVVIKDPWGIDLIDGTPNYRKKKRINFLWFGSRTNLSGLNGNIECLGDHSLTIVSDVESGAYELDGKFVKVLTFSPERLRYSLKNCDAVIIPQNHMKKGKNVKTHNRAVDAIRAGKFLIASPIDAYKDFSKYAWIGNIKEGVEWLEKQDADTVNSMVSAGKEYINGEFSPEVIGKKWENLLSGTTL